MIVLDEQLQGLGLEDAVSRWYRGNVLVVKRLWPGTVIKDDAIVPGKRMNITLSADHRVTDGAEVARYLQVVKRYLENPLTIAFA